MADITLNAAGDESMFFDDVEWVDVLGQPRGSDGGRGGDEEGHGGMRWMGVVSLCGDENMKKERNSRRGRRRREEEEEE